MQIIKQKQYNPSSFPILIPQPHPVPPSSFRIPILHPRSASPFAFSILIPHPHPHSPSSFAIPNLHPYVTPMKPMNKSWPIYKHLCKCHKSWISWIMLNIPTTHWNNSDPYIYTIAWRIDTRRNHDQSWYLKQQQQQYETLSHVVNKYWRIQIRQAYRLDVWDHY